MCLGALIEYTLVSDVIIWPGSVRVARHVCESGDVWSAVPSAWQWVAMCVLPVSLRVCAADGRNASTLLHVRQVVRTPCTLYYCEDIFIFHHPYQSRSCQQIFCQGETQ